MYLGREVEVVPLGCVPAAREEHALVDPLQPEVILDLREGGVRLLGVEVDEGVLLIPVELGFLPLSAAAVVRLPFLTLSVLGCNSKDI